jgi:ATP-binding cassette subfamily F protein uup
VTVLSAQDLRKAYGTRTLLDGVTLTIEEDERVGLVGRNGCGKSTLARILAGAEPADGGTIARRRGSSVGYLAQEPVLDPEQTARQIVLAGLVAWSEAKARHDRASEALGAGKGDLEALLGAQSAAAADVERLGGWDRQHRVDAVLGHVGVTRLEAKVGELSGGDRRRVALARILVAEPDLAILDEPTNHLDAETVEWLEGYLADEHRGAVLLVTHDRYLLDRVATRTLELDRATIYSYDGGYGDYLEAKAERLEHEARTESNRRNFLRTELEWLRRQPKARTTKQKARIQRAESARDIAAPKLEKTAKITIESTRAGKTILDLKKLGLDMGGRTLIRELDLMLTSGERVGIVGRNGTGKTTLLRAILGEKEADRGEVVRGKNTDVAYFDQHRGGLDEAKTVFDNVADGRARVTVGGDPIELRPYLERFLFEGNDLRQPVGSLSGGERARVALAKMLSYGANLVLLDEPTNDLDVATLGALEQMLVDFPGSAIVVTHDRWFLDRIATSILVFEGDGKVVRHAGNYADYRARKAEMEAAAQAEAEAAATAKQRASQPAPAAPAAKSGKLTYAEKIELEGLLDKVDAAETEVKRLEGVLADPSLYATRGGEVPALTAALDKAKAEAARLVTRWEELEEKRAAGGK